MSLSLQEGANIAEVESEAFIDAIRIIFEARRMVWHQKPVISNLAINLQRLDEINITFIRESLDEIIAMPRILRKWTLKILPRSPNQRITS